MAFKKKRKKKKSAGFDLLGLSIALAIIGLATTIYIGYRVSTSDNQLFSLSIFALIFGTLFESFRISNNWKNVVYIFIGSYFLSFFSFIPGKKEEIYSFESHIEIWPYFFLFFFCLIFAISNKEKVTHKMGEGTTLLFSISLIYWFLDYGIMKNNNAIVLFLFSLASIFSLFSFINAFTKINLTKSNRIVLSVWSSIILISFGIDNIIRVYSNPTIESTQYFSQGFNICLQYFLLGVSAIYLVQNFILTSGFLPNKNSNYKEDIKEIKKDHLDRFSDEQVPITLSLFCLFYSGIIYYINYTYHLLPRHTMIWLVFFTFPLILYFSNWKKRKI